jgi:hypothetical protein
MDKAFRLQDAEGKDILGKEVAENHVQIKIYGKLLKGQKKPEELEINEFTQKSYKVKSVGGFVVYTITRVR